MMKEYFTDLVSGIESKLAADPASQTPRKVYALEVARLGRRLYDGEHRVAWCGVTAPFDLLAAMGVTSCFVEFIGAMLATTGMEGHFLEQAEHAGFGGDTCGYHRSVLGAAREGLMPVPDFLIATSCPCTGGLAVMENLARHFAKDLFVLHVPQEQTPAGVTYLTAQLEDMVAFVEAHTGNPLDRERLRRAVELTNQARDLMDETYRLARHVPSPANSTELSNLGIVAALLLGTPAIVAVAQTYVDSFRRKIAAGQSGIADERLRLMWIQNRIQFKHPLLKILATDYGAAVVADELNAITWEAIDPDDPLPGIARRIISIPFNGPLPRRMAHLKQMAADYRVHGAINPCHWGCRQGTGARGMIGAALKEIGVPVLNLEVDCVDSRNFSEGQLRTRLEAFAEMLQGRPSPWGSAGG
jgi:benzoyl-CoA reductase/2-hydroxyglutaryl-CoA dehydratase subunit BcrC/BadD/HgdB